MQIRMIMLNDGTLKPVILAVLLAFLLSVSHAFAQQSSEKMLFSFLTTNNKQCSLSLDTLTETITYRFGNSKQIELEVPDDLNDEDTVFTYLYYFRPGGIENLGMDLNHVCFKRGDYVYSIYDDYAAESGEPTVGITVKNVKTEKITFIQGKVDTVKGSLGYFRFSQLIPVIWDANL